MEFSKQEYWSGLPFPSPGVSLRTRDGTQVSCTAGRFFITEPPGKSQKEHSPANALILAQWDTFQAADF